jgi:hypothetical protein
MKRASLCRALLSSGSGPLSSMEAKNGVAEMLLAFWEARREEATPLGCNDVRTCLGSERSSPTGGHQRRESPKLVRLVVVVDSDSSLPRRSSSAALYSRQASPNCTPSSSLSRRVVNSRYLNVSRMRLLLRNTPLDSGLRGLHLCLNLFGLVVQQSSQSFRKHVHEDALRILRAPPEVILQREHRATL